MDNIDDRNITLYIDENNDHGVINHFAKVSKQDFETLCSFQLLCRRPLPTQQPPKTGSSKPPRAQATWPFILPR